MARGTVKWFSDQKGYGFIASEGESEGEVFVHHSAIEGNGFRTLHEGEVVEFEVKASPQGTQASHVHRV